MLLKNSKNIEGLIEAIAKCDGDVILRSVDGNEEFNMKSALSQYIAIARLCEERGEFYEIFCMNKNDEQYLLKFFHEMIKDSE